jgi:2-alkyl-3-oxoalkanoate reductase
MKVLVTGASGMLGSGVAQALIERGDVVTVLQRRASGLPCAEVRGDLGDAALISAAVDGQDAVVHLAAKVSVTGPWQEFARVNVLGTREVVRAARDCGVSRFVHVSSPSVAHAGAPLVGAGATAADPVAARGNYARSKAMAELAALDAADESMSVVAVRPHLVWGPGDAQLVGRIVARASAGRLVLIDRGSALIDTTYVTNAVDALVAALDHAPDVSGRAFVVSNGEPRTVAEMFARICAAAGVEAPSRTVGYPLARAVGSVAEHMWSLLRRTDDPPMTSFLAEQLATAHWFDQRETQQALHWSPRVSLSDGFDQLATYYAS